MLVRYEGCDYGSSHYKPAGFNLVKLAGLQNGLFKRVLFEFEIFVEFFGERVFKYVVVVVYINLRRHELREL